MGDFRASVKIEFSMFDVKRSCDMWVNWDMDADVDQRVVDFFVEARDAAYASYSDALWIAGEKARSDAEEAKDIAEYERLRNKYEPTP